MDEDQIVGAGRAKLGEAEKSIGGEIGSERLESDGVFKQLAGNVQRGYGNAKNAVSDIIDDAPAAVGRIVKQSRELVHDADSAIREKLGDNGPLYVLAGAVGFLGRALFAVARANQHVMPAKKPWTPRARSHGGRRGTTGWRAKATRRGLAVSGPSAFGRRSRKADISEAGDQTSAIDPIADIPAMD